MEQPRPVSEALSRARKVRIKQLIGERSLGSTEQPFAITAEPIPLQAILNTQVRRRGIADRIAPSRFTKPAKYKRGENMAELKISVRLTESALPPRHRYRPILA